MPVRRSINLTCLCGSGLAMGSMLLAGCDQGYGVTFQNQTADEVQIAFRDALVRIPARQASRSVKTSTIRYENGTSVDQPIIIRTRGCTVAYPSMRALPLRTGPFRADDLGKDVAIYHVVIDPSLVLHLYHYIDGEPDYGSEVASNGFPAQPGSDCQV